MATPNNVQIFVGNIVHCIEPFVVKVIGKGFVIVFDEKIAAIDNISSLEATRTKLGISPDVSTTTLTDSQLLIPGLIDTHIHAPQYPNIGLGYDMQLLDWLNTYTFPLEGKYKDVGFAKKVYEAVVKRTLSHGTTTACYFATMHLESSLVLCDAVLKYGQRALVGKVNMTKRSPPDLTETTEDSVRNTEKFINAVKAKKSALLLPVITPRFAISCDMDVMTKLGALAKKYDVHIQTHISENQEEIKFVNELFGKKYAQVYNEANLLTNKTILAHGVYLEPDEIKLLAEKGTSVSHCPYSNTCLQSGNCCIRKLIKGGINVGLGTDVSAGPSPSIIEAMRSALTTSININFADKVHKPLNCSEAFYLATMGGAKALALDDKIGNFTVGKNFDALIVDMYVENSGADFLKECTPMELLQKFVYVGDDRNVLSVFVNGVKVK